MSRSNRVTPDRMIALIKSAGSQSRRSNPSPSRPPSPMTPEERRRRNRRALKLLLAVFVVGGAVQSVTGPKKLAVMPPDPQTARERAAREHCMNFLWSLNGGSGLSTYSLAGEIRAKTDPDNVAWCERNLDQFMETRNHLTRP
jgi:hypothetical protein